MIRDFDGALDRLREVKEYLDRWPHCCRSTNCREPQCLAAQLVEAAAEWVSGFDSEPPAWKTESPLEHPSLTARERNEGRKI